MSPASHREFSQEKIRRNWYSVSVDTIRSWAIFIIAVLLAVMGYFAFLRWESEAVQEESGVLLEELQMLLVDIRGTKGHEALINEYRTGKDLLAEARHFFTLEKYEDSVRAGRSGKRVLTSVLEALHEQESSGEAQFIAVKGDVQFRRGEQGEWKSARRRVVLEAGDFVKTGSGSVEIMFLDGTLYRVRANSLVIVSASSAEVVGAETQDIELQYGWVNLNTASSGSRVKTPGAAATISNEASAEVSYDAVGDEGRFASFQGAVDVKTEGGNERRVDELQMVRQKGESLSEAMVLPASPGLVRPSNFAEFDIDRLSEISLEWEPQDDADRYALQVADNRLFAGCVIDVTNRRGEKARVGLKGEGSFLWRVAAVSKENIQGPWSEPRQFMVASYKAVGAEDTEPPVVEITDVQSYGYLFIVRGMTEPGAVLTINGDAAIIDADGTFQGTAKFHKEGWALVEIVAEDVSGNEMSRKLRVYVENL